jgi:hypothetical protein
MNAAAVRSAHPVRVIARVAVADYQERVRRHGFIVTLALTIGMAWLFLPPNGARYATVQIDGARGVYGSAWVGCSLAILTSTFLSLIGFYLVRDSVARDRRTGVGEVLATTPMSNASYTLGKAASHFAVLATLALLVAVSAMAIQLLRAEDMRLDPLAVLTPFVVATLPAMIVVAGVAVAFEALPGLGGAAGNVAYFLVWTAAVVGGGLGRVHGAGIGDALGNGAILPELLRAASEALPRIDPQTAHFNIGFNIMRHPHPFETFAWSGPSWSAPVLAGRAAWAVFGVAIAFGASLPFDRFDPARRRLRVAKPRRGRAVESPAAAVGASADAAIRPRATSLPQPASRGFALPALYAAELRLSLLAVPRFLGLVSVGLAIAIWLAPLAFAREWLLPWAWIVPFLAWSGLGSRDARHGTEPLLFSSPNPVWGQLPALWLAGFTVALALSLGVVVRLAVAGDVAGAIAVLTGAAFIPSFALACGTWTASGRLFEALYPLMWYIGPLEKAIVLDYSASTPAVVTYGTPAGFAVAGVTLAALAVAGRSRRLLR